MGQSINKRSICQLHSTEPTHTQALPKTTVLFHFILIRPGAESAWGGWCVCLVAQLATRGWGWGGAGVVQPSPCIYDSLFSYYSNRQLIFLPVLSSLQLQRYVSQPGICGLLEPLLRPLQYPSHVREPHVLSVNNEATQNTGIMLVPPARKVGQSSASYR